MSTYVLLVITHVAKMENIWSEKLKQKWICSSEALLQINFFCFFSSFSNITFSVTLTIFRIVVVHAHPLIVFLPIPVVIKLLLSLYEEISYHLSLLSLHHPILISFTTFDLCFVFPTPTSFHFKHIRLNNVKIWETFVSSSVLSAFHHCTTSPSTISELGFRLRHLHRCFYTYLKMGFR